MAAESGSQTLERGLAVLVQLSRHPEGLTVAEAAAATGLHRSITYRLLVSLHRTGFAARDAEGRYTVGGTVADLAEHSRPRLRDVAEPVLAELARELDATASLVEVHGDAAVTTLVAEPPSDGPRFTYRLGNRDPLDRGAGGLAALASGPRRAGEPERVARVRTAGHVTTSGELNPGAHGIAAPLPGWHVLAAVNVVTARAELLTTAPEAVLRAARAIGAATGATLG
ncbi:helix-turn-helix domain-containing protein [Nocardioides sp. zg-536]|uniref:Helix-turn-helix domain-containing protein n=1 Tax=Nocardioides faecalis TaxID=2803858 RepID=A0A938Y3K7_9ACTN|nr:helix-turn-helix domain-containing protein [Nocardioides faecalis]MBM9459363.1 helix-turn-helix domain-containing protein [Nocardioides faecalis]MBS4751604.1 helix-turn-helix domain-containing protein [Nocardioides faecalis]QVI59523.1 helix-turn-helix domain-containing protein [Nocardioides faecalis]